MDRVKGADMNMVARMAMRYYAPSETPGVC